MGTIGCEIQVGRGFWVYSRHGDQRMYNYLSHADQNMVEWRINGPRPGRNRIWPCHVIEQVGNEATKYLGISNKQTTLSTRIPALRLLDQSPLLKNFVILAFPSFVGTLATVSLLVALLIFRPCEPLTGEGDFCCPVVVGFLDAGLSAFSMAASSISEASRLMPRSVAWSTALSREESGTSAMEALIAASRSASCSSSGLGSGALVSGSSTLDVVRLSILCSSFQQHWHPIMQELQLLVRVCRNDSVSIQLLVAALVLHHIPQPRETHHLAILPLYEVRDLLLTTILLQPFIEAFSDYDTSFALLHGIPHAAVLDQRIVAAVDRTHLGAVVRWPFGPERYKTPFGTLKLILRLMGCPAVYFVGCLATMRQLRLFGAVLDFILCAVAAFIVATTVRSIGAVYKPVIARREIVCLSDLIAFIIW
ncbi:DUF159 domain protein [Hortaea werneckii]|nr:DUF159 domain protein [Hortaea werneckii]